jgi:nucleoside-diphosphate-sugar epimerase
VYAKEPRAAISYLPLDGDLPPNPGPNTYAQSKEFAERMLRLAVETNPQLSATAIRFPMLVTDWLARRMTSQSRAPLEWIDFAECTTHLFLADAAALCADVVDRGLFGYRQYFPAQTMELRGYPVADVVGERYPGVVLKRPVAELTNLADISAITREVGWVPRERLSFSIDR